MNRWKETKSAFLAAVEAWPELNYFVGGTMLSIFSKPGDSDFESALYYVESVDLCAGEDVDRENPLPQMRAKIQDVKRAGLLEPVPIRGSLPMATKAFGCSLVTC